METRETIILDSRAQQRLYVLTHVLAGELTVEEAARVDKPGPCLNLVALATEA